MKAALSIALISLGLSAFAQEQVLAQGTDKTVPEVDLQLPAPVQTPFIQTFHTEKGELASLVTQEDGSQYFVVHVEQAYETQYPQYREADVPNNRSNWVLMSW